MNPDRFGNLLFKMAENTTEGVIVEHGTYRGNGTVQLCLGTKAGANLEVITIDDYTKKQGWIGEHYRPEDRRKFRANLKKADVDATHLQMDIDEAIVGWKAPIGLWYYDVGRGLGAPNRFWNDWIKWNKHVIPGGHVILKDVKRGKLGITSKIGLILGSGAWERILFEGEITILRKK